jgi:hypothetical protein
MHAVDRIGPEGRGRGRGRGTRRGGGRQTTSSIETRAVALARMVQTSGVSVKLALRPSVTDIAL